MINKTENVTSNRIFLNILKKSWPSSKRQFTEEDELYFEENLISFCNSATDNTLSGGDFQTVYDFIEKGFINSLNLLLQQKDEVEYVKKCLCELITFYTFLAHRYNQKITTQLFFKRLMASVLSFPCNIDDPENISCIMEIYEDTGLLRSLCSYMSLMNLLEIDEEILSLFMKKARSTSWTRLFRFYLYPFNDLFFRCNYPSFPDECSAKELYFGIYFGYFTLTYNSEIYKRLLSMCEEADSEIIYKKSHDNPVYNYYLLSEHNNHLSITDIYGPIGRLFRD